MRGGVFMALYRRVFALFISIFMIFSAAAVNMVQILAEAYPAGSFTVETDDPANFTYEDGILKILSGTVEISGTGSSEERIEILGDANVILNDVTVSPDSGPALRVAENAYAKLTLADGSENGLTGGNGYAGLEISWLDHDNMGSLTIDGTGTLNAQGGERSAGIGGSKNNKGVYGNITIESGTVNAEGGSNAAGIGSSDNPANGTSSGSYKYITDRSGTITINGGDITANGSGSGAGIGGGNHTDSGEIIINDGNVTATGHTGIGSGLASSKPDSSGKKGPGYYYSDITINGGTVNASANDGSNGAGIGGGMYADARVTVNGGTITAKGGSGSGNYHHGGAGIGGGYLGNADIVINGGTIYAEGGAAAAGIGSGGSPNNSEARGSSRRSGETELESTAVEITDGDVTSKGGPNGGAGIGGGAGAEEVTVRISGGSVKAYGSLSDPSSMFGGAGIGSGSNVQTGSEAKYMTDTALDIEITGGEVLAVGGWGASGIGSGASNRMADQITIGDGSDIEVYSDGTKFAVDTRILNDDGTTTSRTEGRDVSETVLQGTFVKDGQIGGYDQYPSMITTIRIEKDATGEEEKTLVNKPKGYRSFAATVSSAGRYNVYTDDAEIGKGEGRYFSVCLQDVYDEEKIIENGIVYEVSDGVLSDNFYLYPLKSIVISKTVTTEDGLDPSGINLTAYFCLQRKEDGRFVEKDGKIWVEQIEIINGEAQNRAFFTGIPDWTYDVWECDENGTPLVTPVRYDTAELRKVTTESSTGEDNNATISEDKWTDTVKVENVYGPLTVDITVYKVWDDDQDADGIRPDTVTLELLADGEETEYSAEVSEETGWEYTFTGLPQYSEPDKEIVYTVNEPYVPEGYSASYDGLTVTNTHRPAHDVSYRDTLSAGKTISGAKPEKAGTFRFTLKAEKDGNPMPEGASGNTKTVTVTGEGKADFGTLVFKQEGTYEYRIYEESGSLAGYSYDKSVYTLKYVVTKNGDAMEAERTVMKDGKKTDVSVFTFTNTYSKKDPKKGAQTMDEGVTKYIVLLGGSLLAVCGILFVRYRNRKGE